LASNRDTLRQINRLISESPRPHPVGFDSDHKPAVKDAIRLLEADKIRISASFSEDGFTEEENRMIGSLGLLYGQEPIVIHANPAQMERFWVRFNESCENTRQSTATPKTENRNGLLQALTTRLHSLRRVVRIGHAA